MSELKAKSITLDGTRNIYLKSEADEVIEKLKAENERLKFLLGELAKNCKWIPTTFTPDKNGFETMVQCTNGKKRVASFRSFDLRWYDVNNNNKLNVVKWLWQPRMPSEEKKYTDELRHHKYKRCLAMAKWCEAENYTECWYHENSERCKWTEKWQKRWLELAEKFKEAK